MDTVIDKSIQASKPGPRTNPLVPKSRTEVWIFDPYLLAALISIVTLGLIMVTSSSISMAQKPLHSLFIMPCTRRLLSF
jgi:hypothetical protein